MLLTDYRTAVRDILHDPNANFYGVASVDRWINRARRKVAQKGRCIRRMPPTTASLSAVTVGAAGSGYTAAAVTISAPDANQLGNIQATATATVVAGQVTNISLTNAGAGYVAPPTITITGNGTGATASATLTTHLTTIPAQEVYNLASFASVITSSTPGLGELIGIQSISVSWGAIKPTLARRDFSWLQAYARSMGIAWQNFPQVWAQYGQGTTGSVYLWPIAQAYSALEVDCYFSVADLSDSQTVELIPQPWDEPVAYYAAYLAYLNAQRPDDARTMLGEHERLMTEARAVVTTDVVPDPYGEM